MLCSTHPGSARAENVPEGGAEVTQQKQKACCSFDLKVSGETQWSTRGGPRGGLSPRYQAFAPRVRWPFTPLGTWLGTTQDVSAPLYLYPSHFPDSPLFLGCSTNIQNPASPYQVLEFLSSWAGTWSPPLGLHPAAPRPPPRAHPFLRTWPRAPSPVRHFPGGPRRRLPHSHMHLAPSFRPHAPVGQILSIYPSAWHRL